MRGLNGVMGSLTLLTRVYHRFELQCSSNLSSEFPFEKYSTVVDIGGGIGAFSLPLAKTHKHIKITIQDLPEVLVQARGVSALLRRHPAQWPDLLLGLGRRLSRGSSGEPG